MQAPFGIKAAIRANLQGQGGGRERTPSPLSSTHDIRNDFNAMLQQQHSVHLAQETPTLPSEHPIAERAPPVTAFGMRRFDSRRLSSKNLAADAQAAIAATENLPVTPFPQIAKMKPDRPISFDDLPLGHGQQAVHTPISQ